MSRMGAARCVGRMAGVVTVAEGLLPGVADPCCGRCVAADGRLRQVHTGPRPCLERVTRCLGSVRGAP